MNTKGNSTNSIPLPVPPSSEGAVEPTVTPGNSGDAQYDDLGYEVVKGTEQVPSPAEQAQVVPPVVPPPAEEAKVTNPGTGYGKKEETVTPPVEPEKKEEPKTDEEKVKHEISEVVKGLPEGMNKERVTNFALEHNLSKEQVEAYVKLEKEANEKAVKDREQFVKDQRTSWEKELKEDSEFGANFDKNVDRVEKVFDQYFPNMKKELTKRGGMLPPYIMRDFLALEKVLNPTTTLVTGEAPTVPKEEKHYLDEMYG